MSARSNALSIRDRRALILVNGERSAVQIKQESLIENLIEILENLERKGFIERVSAAADITQTNTLTQASF